MEEQAFLTRLREAPLDAVTRSVYADWLEDRGDSRADYLRAEAALPSLAEGSAGRDEAEGWLEEMGRALSEDWLFQAGARWDLWGLGYPPRRKIPFIKAIRTQRFMGLREAKDLSEALPAVILPGVPLYLALAGKRAFERLLDGPPPDDFLDRPDAPPVLMAVRPADEESVAPDVRATPFYFRHDPGEYLRLLSVRPDRVASAAHILAPGFANCLFQAADYCLGPMPLTLDAGTPQADAAEAVRRLEGLAVCEVVRPDGSAAFATSCLVARRMPPPEAVPRARRGLVRVLGRAWLGYAPPDPPRLLADLRFPRFRCEEIAARLRGVLDLDILPRPPAG
jgi:uncharacterized protein (TIGR02996 family)